MPAFLRFALTASLIVLAAAGCAQEPAPDSSRERQVSVVDSLVRDAQQAHGIPGLAVIVVRSDSVLASGAAGVRRRGGTAPISIQDRFHLGSNTKAMTATLIASLVEAGMLTWQTTPAEVLPALSGSVDPAFQNVTLEQLLAHRAGLQPFTNFREYRNLPPLGDDPTARRLGFAAFLLRRAPAYEPGSKYVYSNAGYAVAAAMAEQAGGASFEEMMRERLFKPLGVDGGIGWPAAADPNQPWGHRTRGGDSLQPHDPDTQFRLGPLWTAAGDVHMSMPDYGRFLQLHLRGLRGEEPRMLSPATIQEMHRSRGRMTDSTTAPGYGLGWVVHDYLGVPSSSHAGSVGTFKARATVQASRDLAVAVVANAGHDASDTATIELRQALLEWYGEAAEQRSAE